MYIHYTHIYVYPYTHKNINLWTYIYMLQGERESGFGRQPKLHALTTMLHASKWYKTMLLNLKKIIAIW